MSRKIGDRSLQGTNRIGLGIVIALTLGAALIITVGDVVFLAVGIGAGLTIGSGLLIGTLLCEIVNRRNR